MNQPIPLKDQMLHRIRATGRSDETFKSYWYWCEKFIPSAASILPFRKQA
jgi:hypothetical protein